MENIYIVKLGNLYLKESVSASQMVYTFANSINGATFYNEDYAKELAKQTGGKLRRQTMRSLKKLCSHFLELMRR